MRSAVAFGGVTAMFVLGACGTSSDAGSESKPPDGVVTGRVLSSPSCPVESRDQGCRPRSVAGAAVVATGAGTREQTHTDQLGHFSFALPSGHYTIRATNVGGYQSTSSTTIRVGAPPVRVTLTVDSGIR